MAVRADVPRCHCARQAYDQRTEDGRPESRNDEVIQHGCDETKHCGVEYEKKQAKRQDQRDPERMATAQFRIDTMYSFMEAEFEKHPFANGNQFSMADGHIDVIVVRR